MKFSEEKMSALINEVEADFSEYLKKSEAEQNEEVQASSEEEIVTETEELNKNEEEVVVETTDFDYDEEDIAEMDKMYSSMSKSEAEAHLESIQRALNVEDTEEETIEKNETEEVVVETKEEDNISKAEVEEIKKENEELKKSIAQLSEALTDHFKKQNSAPKRKAITGIEYIAKSEESVEEKNEEAVDITKLSKSEISTKLNQKIREGKLEKSDKDAINSYYLDNAELKTIEHLLV